MGKDDSYAKTLRHMETVRNFLDAFITDLIYRGQDHDQSKLEDPEWPMFEKNTPKLKDIKFGSPEYKAILKDMAPALEHHYKHNRHHPEFHPNGIADMNLLDLVEMLCDWKASSLRTKDGDIRKSIEFLQKKYGYSDEIKKILMNTVDWMEDQIVHQKGNES
jgi:hypothetical protein